MTLNLTKNNTTLYDWDFLSFLCSISLFPTWAKLALIAIPHPTASGLQAGKFSPRQEQKNAAKKTKKVTCQRSVVTFHFLSLAAFTFMGMSVLECCDQSLYPHPFA